MWSGNMERMWPENEPLKSNLGSSVNTKSLLNHHFSTQSKKKPEEKQGRQGSVCMHVNSLFKFGEAVQSDNFLGSRSTVLDYTHTGLINCKLERKALHGDSAFWYVCVCVLCLQAFVFFCQHFCVPPILTNYIRTGRGESLERHKSKFQNQIIHSHFLFWGLFFKGSIS